MATSKPEDKTPTTLEAMKESLNYNGQRIQFLPLKMLDFDPMYNGRVDVNHKQVERYADAIEFLPPIKVWQNPDFDRAKAEKEGYKRSSKSSPNGNMPFKVLDGVQRTNAYMLASKAGGDAAKKYGEIPAIVVTADRETAQSIGLTANLESALTLTIEERDHCVIGFINLHPEFGDRELARNLKVTHPTILRIKRVQALQGMARTIIDKELAPKQIPVKDPDRSTLHGIAEVPDKYRRQVLRNVITGGWTRSDVRAARNTLARPKSKGETDAEYNARISAALAVSDTDTRRTTTIDQLVTDATKMTEANIAAMVNTTTLLTAIKLSGMLADNIKALDAAINAIKREMQHAEQREDSNTEGAA